MDLRRRIVVIAAVGFVLLAVVTLWGFRETSKPSFCSSCHFIQPYADSWKTSTHAGYGVTCVNCHFEPGVVGYVKGKIYSIIKITQFAAGQTEKKPEAAKLVILSACLQCHDYIRNPDDPRYPKGIVVQGITFPHDFHLNRANLSCADCHSGIAHGGRLVGADKPQAKADPAFCNSCHTGDIAPILFGPIAPAGREHPGAPKIDVNVWRNSHWKLANAAATIDGVQYDKIEPATCNACHDDPTRAKACKSCHFARVPLFSASPQAERASLLPAFMFVFLFAMFVLTVFMRRHEKERLFNSWIMKVVATVVLISDVYVVYRIISDVVQRQTGQHEIGPTTVWVSYLFLSVGLIAFILFEGVLMPRPLHPAHLPKQDEDRFLTPRPIRRLVKKSGADKGAPPAAPSATPAPPPATSTGPAAEPESATASDGASSPEA